ncbi:MAG: hypothetical protein QOG50_3976 [Actinomycetota bacterium]|jgi:hypothetical protein|nr:hypothetical protein [Actinomycetota bacterium]
MASRVDARQRRTDAVPGGNIALAVTAILWIGVLAWYLDHRIFLSSDSMNNYVHVWGIARDLWHHGHLPWRMPELGHGDAYAYPYGFANWTSAAIVWPVLGNWGVTLWTALGAVGCIAATFLAFPELRRGWWAAAVLANPAIIESLLFGQQSFSWGCALLLLGVAAWRRERPLVAALLVGVGQATHAAIVLPIGALLVAACLPFVPDRRALLRWYALSLLITLPAVVLVFVSPGYADATTRDRLVNFIGTLGPRCLLVAMPVIFALARRTGIRAFAPLALVIAVGVNIALEEPLNVAWQWRGFTRVANTASLDSFLRSPEFVPGATYRVLRSGADAKLGLYHVLRGGGRLDSELFPESMAIRDFPTLADYEQLLCDRHVDFVIAYDRYALARHTNEIAVLRRLDATPTARVRLHPVERARDHVVYAVDRADC